MAYKLKRKESLPNAISRILGERLDRALNSLGPAGSNPLTDISIHDARKRLKQIRGALRLVRPELGNKAFSRENRTFRNAGRPLSQVRDAKVMLDTLDALLGHFKPKITAGSFKQLRAALSRRRRQIRQQVLRDAHVLPSIRKDLKQAKKRIKDWPLQHNGWKAVAPGLCRLYQQARKAMRCAARSDSDQALHEWRKRAKDLRYALELLAPAWPQTLEPMAQAAHDLTNLLGDDHDLAVLAEIVQDELEDSVAEAERELLLPLLAQRRQELQCEASALGRKLLAETDDDFIARVHAYWKSWKC